MIKHILYLFFYCLYLNVAFFQVYKYIIQCLVLYNSWPLTESQQMFVQALKDLEKNDNKGMSLQILFLHFILSIHI